MGMNMIVRNEADAVVFNKFFGYYDYEEVKNSFSYVIKYGTGIQLQWVSNDDIDKVLRETYANFCHCSEPLKTALTLTRIEAEEFFDIYLDEYIEAVCDINKCNETRECISRLFSSKWNKINIEWL